MVNVLSLAGPGLKHDIQRALNVRNLKRDTALTAEQADYLDHKGSYEPKPRLRDMDVQGIDQVMIIPTDIDTYPWLLNAVGAKAMCKAYNDWAYEYCQENPERLFFAAMLPMQDPKFAQQEVYRVAAKGCRVGLVRPIDAMGNYPIQPKYDRVWRAMEETGVVYGMHPFPAFGSLKPPGYTEQHSGAELIALSASTAGLPHSFLINVQDFQAEASLWVAMVLMSGFFERYPKLRAAVFEASSTWLSFVLDECDKHYRLYRNDRQLPPLKRLPRETFFEHCVTGFEGDEAPPSRLPEFYENILAWSSDVYHHDGDDAWRAIETMRKCELPEKYQAKFLGENARKLYKIDAPKNFIRDRVTEIERPDWWPTEEEVKASLKPEASVLQSASRVLSGRRRRPLSRKGQSVMANKRFPVFDSDSHVVEPPELWTKYLEPEYRTLGKHALWREEGKLGSYLKVNGKVFRDTMNSNIPRHAIWRPGMTWDKVGRARSQPASSDDRGCFESSGSSARHGCDGYRPGLSLSNLVRRGLPPGRRSGRRVCAGARLQRLDRGLLQGGARPTLCGGDDSAAEHGLHGRGASPRRQDAHVSAAHSSGRCLSRVTTSPIPTTIRSGPSWKASELPRRCILRLDYGIPNGRRTGSFLRRSSAD